MVSPSLAILRGDRECFHLPYRKKYISQPLTSTRAHAEPGGSWLRTRSDNMPHAGWTRACCLQNRLSGSWATATNGRDMYLRSPTHGGSQCIPTQPNDSLVASLLEPKNKQTDLGLSLHSKRVLHHFWELFASSVDDLDTRALKTSQYMKILFFILSGTVNG